MYGPRGGGIAERDRRHAPRSMSSTARWPRASASWAATSPRPALCATPSGRLPPGFIFTTSLAPAIAAGALASIRHLKASTIERTRHQERARLLKAMLARGPHPRDRQSEPHRADPGAQSRSLQSGDRYSLLERHDIYVQPINYPTVPKGTERMRLTPTPFHSEAQMDTLVGALQELWAACPMSNGKFVRLAAA